MGKSRALEQGNGEVPCIGTRKWGSPVQKFREHTGKGLKKKNEEYLIKERQRLKSAYLPSNELTGKDKAERNKKNRENMRAQTKIKSLQREGLKRRRTIRNNKDKVKAFRKREDNS